MQTLVVSRIFDRLTPQIEADLRWIDLSRVAGDDASFLQFTDALRHFLDFLIAVIVIETSRDCFAFQIRFGVSPMQSQIIQAWVCRFVQL